MEIETNNEDQVVTYHLVTSSAAARGRAASLLCDPNFCISVIGIIVLAGLPQEVEESIPDFEANKCEIL